ncbi:hypothetical protein DMX10_29805 [Pseudomonas sp. 57B-090624]|uniref:hypothetical protein n=1 Tax=Pseudomonas sp. 57B-090624 TaxID=2213080 RepID=UPI000DA95B8C|nr:hypothetical protein [Pseudomonas sp. 57B-090624]PZE09702.1 hypothetical protein DMX10_29805 [Pseudomonas sp. 57B-090624]
MNELLELFNKYKDLVSISIASIALIYTAYQVALQRSHNRLTVRPHLDSTSHTDDYERAYSIEITNNGIGPAVLVCAELYYKGELMSNIDPVNEAMTRIQEELKWFGKDSWGHHRLSMGSYISPGEATHLIEVSFYVEASTKPATDFDSYLRENVLLKVWYNSIYGDEYIFISNDPQSGLKPLPKIKALRDEAMRPNKSAGQKL